MLIDSNIIIYAAEPEREDLRQFLVAQAPVVSAISRVEVLGYHKLTPEDLHEFEQFFTAAIVLPVSDAVLGQAIRLRQVRTMSLGDSIVAGTAMVHGHKLVTRNTKHFEWVPGLEVINPIDPT